jgi:hypothetical protein
MILDTNKSHLQKIRIITFCKLENKINNWLSALGFWRHISIEWLKFYEYGCNKKTYNHISEVKETIQHISFLFVLYSLKRHKYCSTSISTWMKYINSITKNKNYQKCKEETNMKVYIHRGSLFGIAVLNLMRILKMKHKNIKHW